MGNRHGEIIHPTGCCGHCIFCISSINAAPGKYRGGARSQQGKDLLKPKGNRGQKGYGKQCLQKKPEVVLHAGRNMIFEKPLRGEHDTYKESNKRVTDKKSDAKTGHTTFLPLCIGLQAGCAGLRYRIRLIYRAPDKKIPWR